MDNGSRLHEYLDLSVTLSKDATPAAWLAMQARGKQKGKEIERYARIREALVADQLVDEKGNVAWAGATVAFRDEDDFDALYRAVVKWMDDEGVDFSMSTGAVELRARVEEIHDRITAEKKLAKAAKAATEGKS